MKETGMYALDSRDGKISIMWESLELAQTTYISQIYLGLFVVAVRVHMLHVTCILKELILLLTMLKWLGWLNPRYFKLQEYLYCDYTLIMRPDSCNLFLS